MNHEPSELHPAVRSSVTHSVTFDVRSSKLETPNPKSVHVVRTLKNNALRRRESRFEREQSFSMALGYFHIVLIDFQSNSGAAEKYDS